MIIFRDILEVVTICLLVLIGLWDLVKKEIPIWLLCGLSGCALTVFTEASRWEQGCALATAVLIGVTGIVLIKRKRMGGGDLWMLVCLLLLWPAEVFWQSLVNGGLILCTAAVGIWIATGDGKFQIPMIPFLLLGYWTRGCIW